MKRYITCYVNLTGILIPDEGESRGSPQLRHFDTKRIWRTTHMKIIKLSMVSSGENKIMMDNIPNPGNACKWRPFLQGSYCTRYHRSSLLAPNTCGHHVHHPRSRYTGKYISTRLVGWQ
ncbi:hypothetical protein Mapa_004783 [Marchantia paleacea]|nr:hypothetical protein Mapa_004783 [Marchantia paleacea]